MVCYQSLCRAVLSDAVPADYAIDMSNFWKIGRSDHAGGCPPSTTCSDCCSTATRTRSAANLRENCATSCCSRARERAAFFKHVHDGAFRARPHCYRPTRRTLQKKKKERARGWRDERDASKCAIDCIRDATATGLRQIAGCMDQYSSQLDGLGGLRGCCGATV